MMAATPSRINRREGLTVITCPHCHFMLAGPDMPTRIEPGMVCPVCFRDMSLPPEIPPSRVQGIAKVVVAIFGGAALAMVVAMLVPLIFDPAFHISNTPVGLVPVLGFFLAFGVNSKLNGLMSRRHDGAAARWLLLLGGLAVCAAFWAGIVLWWAREIGQRAAS